MSGAQRLLVGVLVVVPLATIAALVVAVLLMLPTSSETSTDAPTPVTVAAPVINVPDEISLGTNAAIARTITAGGTGTATAVPNVAEVTLGVETVEDDAGAAISDNNARMTEVTEKLRALGVATDDIQTTGFNMWTEQVYGQDGPTGEVRYHLSNQVRATVRDVDGLGDILQAALDASANSVHNMIFAVDDEEGLKAEARAEAIANARAHAEQMAAELGVELGEIISISELGETSISPSGAVVRAEGMGGGGGPPVSGGGYTASVSVAVVFAIAN